MPFPTPRDLPNPDTEPVSLMSPALAGRFLPLAPPGKLIKKVWLYNMLTSEKYYKSGLIEITFTALYIYIYLKVRHLCAHGETIMWGHSQKLSKAEASEETKSVDALILDFQPPKLWDKKCWFFFFNNKEFESENKSNSHPSILNRPFSLFFCPLPLLMAQFCFFN